MTSTTISLQAPHHVSEEKRSLAYLIARINEQKGSFRNVTEESLQEEVGRGPEDEVIETEEDDEEEENVEEADEVEDDKSRRERFAKARGEMIQNIGNAREQSQMALDLVSILLSQRAPASAAQTMSPIIKQLLPTPGSITTELVTRPKKTEAEIRHTELVSMGWRMQSLNQAADSLLGSATQLQKEIAKETSYWDQVLRVKEKGWALSRMLREKHTLGVHFGFAEANPKFRDRGQGALRLSEDSSLYLDSGVWSKKRLSLRLINNDQTVATYASSFDTFNDDSIEQEILSARDSIFDEELFYELNREARFLTNQGVEFKEDTISLPYTSGQRVEVSLVPVSDLPKSSPFEPDNQLLKGILLALRVLLSEAHNRTHKTRTGPPKSLSNLTRSDPPHPILKNLVEVFAHRTATANLQEHTKRLTSTLKAAGLEAKVESSSPPLLASKGARARNIAGLIESFTTTTTTLSLQGSNVSINTKTSVLPPSFGTGHRVTSTVHAPSSNIHSEGNEGDSKASSQTSQTFHSLTDLSSEFAFRIQEVLRSYILSSFTGWQNAERGIQWLVRAGKDAIKIQISEDADTLSISWRGMTVHRGQQEWVWSGTSPIGSEQRSLQEVLEAI